MNNKNIANTTLSSNRHQIKKIASRVIELEQIEAGVKLPLPDHSMEVGKRKDLAHNCNETCWNTCVPALYFLVPLGFRGSHCDLLS